MNYIKLDDALKVCSKYEEWYADMNDQCGEVISDNIYQEILNLPSVDVIATKWIDVNERLPEIIAEKTRFEQTVKKSIRVLCVCKQKSGKVLVKEGYCEWFNWSDKPSWRIPGNIDSVTHWMPLPEPPKMDTQ